MIKVRIKWRKGVKAKGYKGTMVRWYEDMMMRWFDGRWCDGTKIEYSMPEASKSNIHGNAHGKSLILKSQPRRG
jgi:hypothetical protein